jgi:hypothetical protein
MIADVLAVWVAADGPADPRFAERIAREIHAHGDLDRAIAALANDDAHALLSDLLAYRSALGEMADPRRRLARLCQDADDLDARAEPLWAEAANCAGRASFRRSQGETELAVAFQRQAEAAERVAAALEADAFSKRLEAAGLQAALAAQDAFDELLNAVAA